jgi:histidine triad (HIT) family protein
VSSPECAFCEIIASESVPFLWSDDNAVVFAPRGPNTQGHVMVVPRVHVAYFHDVPLVTAWTMGAAARYAQAAKLTNYGVIVNVGPDGGQTVFHLRVHLHPRHAGDMVTMPWPDRRGPVPLYGVAVSADEALVASSELLKRPEFDHASTLAHRLRETYEQHRRRQ